MLPPISVEGQNGAPRMATRLPSPPEEPPAEKFVLNGFNVRPQRLLQVSRNMPVWGMVVLTKNTATWADEGVSDFDKRSQRILTSCISQDLNDRCISHAFIVMPCNISHCEIFVLHVEDILETQPISCFRQMLIQYSAP